MNILKLFFFTIFFSQLARAEDVILSLDGKELAKVSLEEIKKMKPQKLEYFNRTTLRSELYVGISTLGFIENYFPDIQKLHEVEFITDNDINPFIAMKLFQNTNSILAYDRADGDKFVRFSKKEKILVPLSPLYLVWDFKGASSEVKKTHRSLYQIRKINLITNKVDLGIHQDKVDASIFMGYETYKRHCLSCHAIGKVGGKNSYDLVKRLTVQSKGAEYVKKYIYDPNIINPKTKMLPFPKLQDSETKIQGIVDFLTFMENPEIVLKNINHVKGQARYKALKEIVNQMQ